MSRGLGFIRTLSNTYREILITLVVGKEQAPVLEGRGRALIIGENYPKTEIRKSFGENPCASERRYCMGEGGFLIIIVAGFYGERGGK